MQAVRARAPWGTVAGCWLMVFLVLFPKGGLRLGSVPLTWGYLLLAAISGWALVVRIVALPLVFPRRIVIATFVLMPMQLLFLYAGKYYGVSNPPFAFSTFVGLFALPWIFLLVFAPFYPLLDGERLARWFCHCIFYAAAWGIFLFFLHPVAHRFIEIPYLTVNASDYGELESTKNIARGLFFKLISTYNNGNLYGVATLLLLPMYLRLEPSRLRRATVRGALLLTLSRTVWVGLVLNEVLSLALHLFRQVRTFPVLYLGAARRRFLAVLGTMVLIVGALFFTGIQSGLLLRFLFDPTVGNRAGEFQVATHSSWLQDQPLYGFADVLYASAAQYWGWSGFVSFTLIMLSPALYLLWNPAILRLPMQRAAIKGLLIYIVMAGSDGALDFIPVMAFYWFVYSVMLCGWPGAGRLRSHVAEPEPELGLEPTDSLTPSGSVGPMVERPA